MTENDKTDTSRSISDEELMKNEVIGDDADLYYLDCYLSDILGKPPFFIPVSSDDYRRRAARPHPVTTPASPRA